MVYCDWEGDIRLCAGQVDDILLMAMISPAILLLFSPTALTFLFERLGWPRRQALAFAVPMRLERAYLVTLGVLSFVAIFWAVTPTEGWQENRVIGMLLEYTSPGKWAAQALFVAGTVGGFLLAASLLQYALERRLGQTYATFLLGTATFAIVASLATSHSIRGDVLLLWGLIGGCLIGLFRTTARFPLATGVSLSAIFLAIGALRTAGIVALGGYESVALISQLLLNSW